MTALHKRVLHLQLDRAILRREVADLGPQLHGVLMSLISSDLAASLHHSPVNPYSQLALPDPVDQTRVTWQIGACGDELAQQLFSPLTDLAKTQFSLTQRRISAAITGKQIVTLPRKQLDSSFFATDIPNRVRLRFLTPTTFKQRGECIFWPEPRLVFQSLAYKYSMVFDDEEPEPDLIDEIARVTRLHDLRVESKRFRVGDNLIPGFTGTVTFTFAAAQNLTAYLHLLTRCGEILGCGAKTSLGMGAIEVLEIRNRKTPVAGDKSVQPAVADTHVIRKETTL
jgi:CRISPR-associated endoribonuclease Cas6